MKGFYLLLMQVIFLPSIFAQEYPTATTNDNRNTSFDLRNQIRQESQYANIESKNIGPSVFSGRVVDLAINPADPSIFYVAYASGGLWKTESNGTRFTPIFDHQNVMTIGAIAVDWKNNRIWVGTGEVNSSRSSYAGNGVYYSDDDGKQWTHVGLDDTHHIGRIIVDPQRKNTVYVAALGHLYSDNVERGVFVTNDGGESWQHTLAVNDKTGAVDLIIDPENNAILYAAMWQRKRSAWNFQEAGRGSGIYKSNDKGLTWSCVSCESEGFPTGEGVGRIGLSAARTKNGTIVYAILDNYNRRTKEIDKEDKLHKGDFKTMMISEFDKLEEDQLEDYLRSNRYPKKYSAVKVKELIKNGDAKITDIANYLEDANRMLFDTPVIGAEVYSTIDKGESWSKTHDDYIDNLYNSYGYYFGQIRTNPSKAEEIFIMGVPILRSEDGGKSFENINGDNVHVDHHALWVNPNRSGHLINGNDGGVNISYDNGESWYKCNTPAVGQFYYINVDHDELYNVYGGTQDNGVWKGSHTYRPSDRWHNIGKYPYQTIMGGDGMQVQIDSRNNNTVYTGYQFGNYFRINLERDTRKPITPKHDLGQSPYRWNWQSPIHLSIHNEDILYLGANKVFRSLNRGDEFKAISEDLTKGGKKGDIPYGTLTSLHESPLSFGLLYAGSDDGLVHISRDGGFSWNLISEDLPQDMWVSRVQASAHEEGTVFLSLNGYRWDNFESMVYRSDNYGDDWIQIGIDLPAEPVNVIKEDPISKDILYVGTDHGTYFSLNNGKEFSSISNDIPAVPVHDLVVHPTHGDLLIGTHGRSIYRIDMQALRTWIDTSTINEDLCFLSEINISHNKNWGQKRNIFSEVPTPEFKTELWVNKSGAYSFNLKTSKGKLLKSWTTDLVKGYNYLDINLEIDKKSLKHLKDNNKMILKDNGKYYLPTGKYLVESGKSKRTINIE